MLGKIQNKNRKIIAKVGFTSHSQPDKSYETIRYSDGTYSCNCPGWTRHVHRDGSRHCRHITLMADTSFPYLDETLQLTDHGGVDRLAHLAPKPEKAPAAGSFTRKKRLLFKS